jgi:two-component system, OmpR family, response regulator QseB
MTARPPRAASMWGASLPVATATLDRSPPVAARRRILAAAADAAERAWLAASLDALGCEATFAGDGDELVQRFLAGGFDLLLLDAELPGLPGPEAVALLRRLDGEIPIVLLCKRCAPLAACIPCMEGGSDCLVKPLRLDRLYRVLAERLSAPRAALEHGEDQALGEDLRALRDGFMLRVAASYLEPMQAAVRAGDRPTLSLLAHRLAGTAGCHRLTALAQAAGRLQAALKREPATDDRQLQALLDDVLAAVA